MESPLLRDIILRFFGEIEEPEELHIPSKGDAPISRALSFGKGKFLFMTPINASAVAAMKCAVGGDVPRPKVLIVVKGGTRISGDDKIPTSWDVRKIQEEQVAVDVIGHVLNGGSTWGWNPDSAVSLLSCCSPQTPSVRIRERVEASLSGLASIKVDDPLIVQLVGKPGDHIQVEGLPVVSGGDHPAVFLATVKR